MRPEDPAGLAELIRAGVRRIAERYGVTIIFTDVLGAFSENPAFRPLLSPMDFHDNDFCNLVKQDDGAFRRCMESKKKAARRCAETRGFFAGYCHMGVYEYIFPIFHGQTLLAFLSAGEFRNQPNISKINTLAKGSLSRRRQLVSAFDAAVVPLPADISEMVYDVQALAGLFAYWFAHFLQLGEEPLYSHPLVNKAIFFIQAHFSEPITLSSIARHCYCHKNYLCELFHQTTGTRLSDYIGALRIRKAAHIMRTQGDSVGEIAAACGFASAGYFATVFKKQTGLSPSQYKLNILKGNAE